MRKYILALILAVFPTVIHAAELVSCPSVTASQTCTISMSSVTVADPPVVTPIWTSQALTEMVDPAGNGKSDYIKYYSSSFDPTLEYRVWCHCTGSATKDWMYSITRAETRVDVATSSRGTSTYAGGPVESVTGAVGSVASEVIASNMVDITDLEAAVAAIPTTPLLTDDLRLTALTLLDAPISLTAQAASLPANFVSLSIDGSGYVTSTNAGSGSTAQEVWEYATRSLTDKTGFTLHADYNAAKTSASSTELNTLIPEPIPFTDNKPDVNASANVDEAAVADAVWNEVKTGHSTANSYGLILGKFLFDTSNYVKAAVAPQNLSPGVLQSGVTIVDSTTQSVVRGDIKPFTFNLGSTWNLTDKKVYFIVKADRTAANSTAKVNRVCTVTDAVNGIATITLTSAETDTIGSYYAEIEVRNTSDANPQTAKQFILKVLQDARQ